MGNVTLENVTKVYTSAEEEVVAVSDLDLTVQDGEFLVLVGPSGCGKSTTLRMIAGLESITEGTIRIGGEVVNDKEPKERDIAMVFQNYALYPHMSVRENIGFGLKYSSDLSKAEMDEVVEETAEMMGIEELLEDSPDQLSGGQRQRVALGRAIVRKPEAFLFDEPLSNLDAKLRTHMRTEISKLQNDLGITSVYVTHDQAEAMTMADWLAVLNDGELQQVGTPNEVYEHPANRFVAGFIGSPSMNFAPVTYEETDARARFVDRTGGAVEYAVDAAVCDRLDVADGAELTLGVRPEDVESVAEAESADGDQLIETTVEVVEPMGSDNFLTLDVGHEESWVARVDSSFTPAEGSPVSITFDQAVLHVFGPDGTTLKSQGIDTGSYHEEPLQTH
jgi:multiple sugar transport system ATP-binding protein